MIQQEAFIEREAGSNLIGIISDSHDNMDAIKRAVDVFNSRNAMLIFHAGDVVSPFTADVFSKLKGEMILIYGNNDGDKLYLKKKFDGIGTFHNDPYIGEINGKSIAMTHKPEIVDALSLKYDIVIYGQTHEIDVRKEECLIVNPGECCGYLTERRTVAIIDLNKMEAEIIEL